MSIIDKIITKIKSKLLRKHLQDVYEIIKGGEVLLYISAYKGLFKMDARSHIFKRIINYKSFEPENVEFIEKYNRYDFVDVGANIGLYSVLFSKLASKGNRKVLSIEPNPEAYKYLEINLKYNKDTHLTNNYIYKGIVTNKEGKYILNHIKGLSEFSSTKEISHPGVLNKEINKIDVFGETLDNLITLHALRPGLIKIDVEGEEYNVLLGAIKTIQLYRPIVMIEINDFDHKKKDISEPILNYFLKEKYKIFDLNLKIAKKPFIGDFFCLPDEFHL
ncbi:FkbM family methyltransferase [Telluribacter humicola]|uniref:FkbM family methyltransferase n=1 Tax=Telluribacter humicola TaxID=1720261 RepID=UPI001A9705E6|nr:FkbM family methyltransferase [Telluribacter humicola]